jgi:hypothetical protein
MTKPTLTFRKGSRRSGHRGHAGRPGKVGGSVPGKGSSGGSIDADKRGYRPPGRPGMSAKGYPTGIPLGRDGSVGDSSLGERFEFYEDNGYLTAKVELVGMKTYEQSTKLGKTIMLDIGNRKRVRLIQDVPTPPESGNKFYIGKGSRGRKGYYETFVAKVVSDDKKRYPLWREV